MNYFVVGAGRMAVGVIHDLIHFGDAKNIIVFDNSEKALSQIQQYFNDKRIQFVLGSADDREKIIPLMIKSDGVLSAVPYEFNLELTKWSIETRCHFVDLGGNNQVVDEQFKLNEAAKRAGIGVIPDCGLAPGMASVVAADAISKIENVTNLHIRVGGLPLNPRGPLNYMLVFSVHGLTNEYIEPVVILENARQKVVEPMTGIEELEFPPPFGKVEAFYTSGGTSTLPRTFSGKIQNLDYKTIRYSGHCQLFKAMIDLNFAQESKLVVNNQTFTRREIFEHLLVDALSYDSKDVVLIRIEAKGKTKAISYQAIEYEDEKNGLTAMMRTTAFPAALTLQMLTNGSIKDRGVLRQELAIPTNQYIAELEQRNIKFKIVEKQK